MAQCRTIAIATLIIEVILLALTGVLIAAGFVIMAFTGSGAGTMTGYNTGLTLILLAATMTVGAGALHFHRQHMLDHARLMESNARLGRELKEMRRCLHVLMVSDATRNNKDSDQLEQRRRSRN